MATTLEPQEDQEQEPEPQQQSLAERIAARKAARQAQPAAATEQPAGQSLEERIAARKAARVAQPTPEVPETGPPVAQTQPPVAQSEPVVAPGSSSVAPPATISEATRRVGMDALQMAPPPEFQKDPNATMVRTPTPSAESVAAAETFKKNFGAEPQQVAEEEGTGAGRGIVTTGKLQPIGVPRSDVESLVNAPDLKTRIASRLALEHSPSGTTIAGPKLKFHDVAAHTLLNYFASPFIGGIADEDTDEKLRQYAEQGGKLNEHQINILATLGAGGAVTGNVAVGEGLGAGTGLKTGAEGVKSIAAGLNIAKSTEAMRAGAQRAIAEAAEKYQVHPSQIAKAISSARSAVAARAPQLAEAAASGAAQAGGGAALAGTTELAQGERDPEIIAKEMARSAAQFGLLGAAFHGLTGEAQFRAGYKATKQMLDRVSKLDPTFADRLASEKMAQTPGEPGDEFGASGDLAVRGEPKESAIAKAKRQMAERDAGKQKSATQENFEDKATESFLEQMKQRAAAGEKVPGIGNVPREQFEQEAKAERENTPTEPQPSFSAYHALLDYTKGEAENPPTHWANLAPMSDKIASDYGFTPEQSKSVNDALSRLRGEQPPTETPKPKIEPGTRLVSPNEKMELYRTIAPDAEVKVGTPIPEEGKKFPVTKLALEDYAKEKGLSVEDAAAKMRAANYDVSDDVIRSAGGAVPEEVGSPVDHLPGHDIQTIINANGFHDHVQKLVDAGVDNENAQRAVVEKYKGLLDSGLSAKDAQGKLPDEIESLLPKKEPEPEPVAKEADTERPATQKKRIGKKAKDEAGALPEGFSVVKKGDSYTIQHPEGDYLRSRSWTSEDAAIAQGAEAIKHAKYNDWGVVPFSELKRRVAGKSPEELEARSKELIEQQKGLKQSDPAWQDSHDELNYIDQELDHLDRNAADKAEGEKRRKEATDEYNRIIKGGADPRQVMKPPHMIETADDALRADAISHLQRWVKANPDVHILKDGMPDSALEEALEWGTGGQTSNAGWIERGSKSWKLMPDGFGNDSSAEYKGKKLLDKVRELVGIPRPGETKPAEAETKRPPKKRIGAKEETPAPKIRKGSVYAGDDGFDQDLHDASVAQARAHYNAWQAARESLESGKSDSGRPLTEKQRKNLEMDVSHSRGMYHGTLAEITNAFGSDVAERARASLEEQQPGSKAVEAPKSQQEQEIGEKSQPKPTKAQVQQRAAKKLEDKAAAARERIRQRQEAKTEKDFHGEGGKPSLSPAKRIGVPSKLDPEDLSDYAMIGASHMADGKVAMDDWSEAMVADLGESVRPYLRQVFGAAIQTFNDELEAAEAELATGESTPSDILKEEEEPSDAKSLRGNVEGGTRERRPGDIREAEGERAPGSDGGGRGGEGGRGVSGVDVEPREGVSGPEGVRGESPAPSDSGLNGKGEGVGGDLRGDDERGGQKGSKAGVRRRKKPDDGVKGTDYRLTDADAIGEGGERTKARDNISAIETALKIRAENRPATREEQAVMAKYVGWGGLKPVFEPKGEKFYQEIHDKLKDLLSPEEFEAAKRTILNAHYTSPTVVRAIWSALDRLGFKGGNVLEPGAGVGNFIGLIPDHLKADTHFTAVERDRITSTIAGLLYPEQNVVQSPFEKYVTPEGSVDVAAGNPPFGDIPVFDKSLPKELTQQIHDYFFVRSVNALRPGGVLAFVTSDGTMDKASAKVRSYLADKTKLIAAIRLPNSTFEKNARTKVTTDIIILQKLAEGERPSGPAWRDVVSHETPEGTFRINEYFAKHPEQMLGHLEEGGQYSKTGDQKLVADEGANLADLLKERVDALPKNIIPERQADTRTESAKKGSEPLPEKEGVRDGGMFVGKNGDIMRRQGGEMVSAGVPKSRIETVKGLIGIRDAINVVRRINSEGGTDVELARAQKKLRQAYDSFVEKFGPINTEQRVESAPNEDGETTTRVMYPNLRSFEYDPDSPFVRALENYDYEAHEEQGDKYRPETADIMHRRTIAPREKLTKADTPSDALISSLNERGAVDLPYMAELTGQSVDEVRDLLKGRIYQNPENGKWETADQYLSGNVKKKLAIAQAELQKVERSLPFTGDIEGLERQTKGFYEDADAADAANNPEHAESLRNQARRLEKLRDSALKEAEKYRHYLALKDNISALEKVIPADLPPTKIAAVLGAPWIPERTIVKFAVDKLGLREPPQIHYNSHDGTWTATASRYARRDAKNTKDFGTPRVDGFKLLEYALNMKHPIIRDKEGVKEVAATLVADDKMEALKDAFSEWLWKDDARAKEHARIYNDRYNTSVIPKPDGSYLEMPGVATYVEGRPFAFLPHQRNFIARFLQWGRAAAFHVVGAGKTFAAIASIMEAKRLGLIRKAIVTVPNHMLGQWTREFLQLYPGANLLVATEFDFDKARRREFLARMASSDYDAIIITHSAFERVPMSLEAQQRYVQQEMDDLETVIRAADEATAKDDKRMVRELEKSKEKLAVRLEALRAESKKDDLLDFEDLGVDHITVDEAHMFKNLNFNTTLQGVRGRPSQRASDLEMKLRYLHKVNPKHSAMLLTGTPISNTFSEAYVMQRYMQPEALQEKGLMPFDAWAKTFARERMALEMKASGDGFKQKSRFDRFVNLGEFAQMFRSFADIQMAHPDALKPGEKAEDFPVEPNLIRLERPPLIGGKAEMVIVPPTDEMKDFMKALIDRAKYIKRRPGKGEDNMLSITNDGRLAALDLRTVLKEATDSPTNKLSIAAGNIAKIYHETNDIRGTQLVFSDILRASKKGVPGFDVYQDLIKKLVERGVKRSEIAVIHDYETQAEKMDLFMKVRKGDIRVLIGSTEKMGPGTNVQTRLVAEHQLDVRWRPSDVEQREGRILRQGNQLYREGKIPGVHILRYASEGSIDAFQWGMVSRKAGMIAQGMTADADTREIEDIDDQAMSYAELAAAASGDPRIMRKAELDAEVGKLERLRRGHEEQQWYIKREVADLPKQIAEAKDGLAAYQADAKTVMDALGELTAPEPVIVDENGVPNEPKTKFKIELGGKEYTSRAEANKILVDAVKSVQKGQNWRPLGHYAGLQLQVAEFLNRAYIGLEGKALYDAVASQDRPVASVEAIPHQIPRLIAARQEAIEEGERKLAGATERVGQPFPHQAKLDRMREELQSLNIALADKGDHAQQQQPPKRDEVDVDDDFYGDDEGGDLDSPFLSPASKRTRASLGGVKRGPSLSALDSPASASSPVGHRIRQILGMSPADEAASIDRVKSLRTITVNLSKMVDVPIRQGRFLAPQRRAAGAFFVKPEVARVIRLDMLDVASHEVGHYVSKHYLGAPTRRIGTAPNAAASAASLPKLTPAMKSELVKLGKDLYGTRKPAGGYGEEGIAEWTNFYVSNPAKAASDAPEFSRFMDANVFANEPGLKAALDQARKDFADYQKAPATARLDAMISVKPSRRWGMSVTGLVRAWIDDLYDVKQAVDELGGVNDPAKDAYILARLSRGGAGGAEDMVENGVVDPRTDKRVTRGLADILEDVGHKNLQEFRRYLISERALELWHRGVDPGISRADAESGVKLYRDKYGELAEDVWEISRSLINYRVAKGLLTQDEADQILENNQRRVPFYRVFDEEASKSNRGIGKGYARNSSGIKRIKGSVREIIDPLESIISDIYTTVKQSHAAEVMQALVRQAEDVEGGGRVVEVLTEAPKRALNVSVEDVKWQLQELGIQVPNILKEQPGILTAFENVTQARGADVKDLVMPIVMGGRRRWVQVKNAALYDAVSGLGTPQIPEWLRLASIPTRTLRAGATLTPEFMFRNPFRDAWNAARFSQAGRTVTGYHVMRGFFHLVSKDGLYEEWKRAGADNAAALGIDRPDVVTHLYGLMHSSKHPLFDKEVAKLAYDDTYNSARREGLSDSAAARKAAAAAAIESRGWVLRPIDTLRMLSAIAENATRLTEYERVKSKKLREGASPRSARAEAAFASRDLTLDFNKAGVLGRSVNQIMSFFNANLLDMEKEQREFRKDPGSYLATALAYLTIPSLLLWLMQKDDDEYRKIPAWQKAMAWVIIQRDGEGNVTHRWRIPKPPGPAGVLFATTPVAIADWITKRDPKAFDHMSAALNGLNPLHYPDAIQPLIEWWANKNMFTGRNIVPEGLDKLPAGEQATARTGELARQIGRGTNLSPAKLENTVKDYTGGLGQYGMDIGNVVTRASRQAIGAEPFPRPPQSTDEKITNVPVIRGFTFRKPQLDAQPIQDALDAFAQADGYRTEWRRRVEAGSKDADSYFEAHKADITAAAGSTDHLGGIGKLRVAHDAIVDAQRASRDAEPEERDRIAQAAIRAAQDALSDQMPDKDDRRILRKASAHNKKEGQQNLKRIGRPK